MLKPWKGEWRDGTDIEEVCLQTWEMLERSLTNVLPITLVNKLVTPGSWIDYNLVTTQNSVDLSRLFYTFITGDIKGRNLRGSTVIGIMFAITPPTNTIARHPIQARYNIATGTWDFRVDVQYEELILKRMTKQVSLKDALSYFPPPDNPPEEIPNSKSPAICTREWIVQYLTETDKAVLVRGIGGWERWVPKSQMSDKYLTEANGKFIGMTLESPPTISFYTPQWLWDKVKQEIVQEEARKKQQTALGALKQRAEMDDARYSVDSRLLTSKEVGRRGFSEVGVKIFEDSLRNVPTDDERPQPAEKWQPNDRWNDAFANQVRMDSFGTMAYEEPKSSPPEKPKNEPKVTIVKVTGKRKLDI